MLDLPGPDAPTIEVRTDLGDGWTHVAMSGPGYRASWTEVPREAPTSIEVTISGGDVDDELPTEAEWRRP